MAQYARPDSDVTVSSWAPSTGSTLYECIDETSYSDADYISRIRADDTCEVGLSNVTDPASSSGHILRVRNQKAGTGTMATCTAKLMQGSTTIATFTCTCGAMTTDEFTLSSAEADSITDYSDLRVRLTADWTSGLTTGWVVSWVEFEVPDASATYNQSVSGSLTASGALERLINMGVGGSVSPAGSPINEIGKGIAGALTAAGTAVLQAAKSLAGSIIPSADLGTEEITVVPLALDGSITVAGSVARDVGKSVVGVLTAAGALTRDVSKGLAGSITGAGALAAGKTLVQSLAGSITAAGSLARKVLKEVAGTVAGHSSVAVNGEEAAPPGTVQVRIGGTDYTDYLITTTLRWTEYEGGQTSALSLEIEDTDDAFAISEWQEVKVRYDNAYVWGGYIVRALPGLTAGDSKRWSLQCESYDTLLNRAPIVRKSYIGQTPAQIIADLFTTAGLTDFDAATQVGVFTALDFATNGEKMTDVLDRLALLCGAAWSINVSKQVVFKASTGLATAPYSVAAIASANFSTSYPPSGIPALDIDASDIRNRVTVIGGVIPSSITTETFTGDASTTTFQLGHAPVHEIVKVTVDGVLQWHGYDYYDTNFNDYDCLVDYTLGTVRWLDAPAAAADIEVQYRYKQQLTVTVTDDASATQYSRYFDYELRDSSLTTQDACTAAANAILDEYAFPATGATLDLEYWGPRAGQRIQVEFPALGLTGYYVIRQATIELGRKTQMTLVSLKIGGRPARLSRTVGGERGSGSLLGAKAPRHAQEPNPSLSGEVDLLRVRDRIEVIDRSTTFGGPGDYGDATGVVLLYDAAAQEGAFLGLNNGALQAYFDSDGTIKWDGGQGILDSSGLAIGSSLFGQQGIQAQYNGGAPRLYVGNGSTNYLKFDGVDASIGGLVYATGGHFSGSVYVGASSPRIHLDGANKRVESTNFASGSSGFRLEGATGDAEVNNLTSRGSIRTVVFEKSLVSAFAGSQMVSKSASTLYEACAVSGSTFTLRVKLQAGGAPFASGDVVRLKDGAADAWATVDAGTNQTTYWQYTATYRSGSTSGTFPAGHAVIDYGQSGDGLVWITADDGSYDPYISVKTHSGSPWSGLTERARLGNLSGISGASGFGLWSDNAYLTGEMHITNPEDIAGSAITNDAGWTSEANLVRNGDVELGSDNWSAWTRETSGGYLGPACLSHTGYQGTLLSDDYIRVDSNGVYELAAAFKTALADTTLLAGLACYTEEGYFITVHNCHRYGASYDTTLYEACLLGATTVKIVPPSSDWSPIPYPAIHFEILPSGADLPNLDAKMISGIDKGGAPAYWTLTLGTGTNKAYGAGTAVGVSRAGGTYIYCLLANEAVGSAWSLRTAQLSGVNAWDAYPDYSQFMRGTKKVRFVALTNRNQSDTTYVDAVALTKVQEAVVDAATTATNFFGSNGSLVNTPSPSAAGLYMGATHMGYYNGSAWKTYMDNTGKFYFSGAAGARIAWDGTDLLGTDGSTVQWYARASTGKLYAAAGAVYLDSAGVNLTYAADDTTYSKMIKWWNGTDRVGQMYTKEASGEPWLMLESIPVASSKYGYVHLRAYGKDTNGDYNSAVIKLRGGNDLTGDTGIVQVMFNNNITADLGPSGNTFYTKTTAGVSLKAKAISGQTGDLFRALDGSGNRLWGIDIAGGVVSAVGAIWFHEWLEDTQSDGNGMKFHYGSGSWWAVDTGGSTQYAYMPLRFPYLDSRARIQITKATIYYNTQTSGAYITSIQIMQANADGTATQLAVDNTDRGNGSTGDGNADFFSGTLNVTDKPMFVRLGYTDVSASGDVRVYGIRCEYTTITA